ncbi:unnamed protein product [Symbiodinium microadriaticum]|nr:unnamed protein product [Symbiodinium microadriaticum]
MDGVRVFHDERVGYRWLDSDALDIWCQEEPTLRTSRQIWADFERRGCGQQDASFPGFQLWGKEIRCYRVHVRKATTPGKNKASKDAVSLKVGWGSDESNLHPGRWDTTSLCISGCGTTCHGGYGRPWCYVGDRYGEHEPGNVAHEASPVSGKYKPYFEAGYTIETGVRLNQKGTIDIYYRVNDGYAGWDVASPQATLESGAAFTIPWKGGESLLPSVAGGINFGPEWEVTVDFNCSPDFKELLGISSPLAPPAKRQRFDDASSSDARKKCAECGEEGGPEAKFCSQCGHRFDNSTDVEVISFTLDGEEVLFNEDDWEEFRRIVCERDRAMDVKREDGYQKRSDVIEVNLDQVRARIEFDGPLFNEFMRKVIDSVAVEIKMEVSGSFTTKDGRLGHKALDLCLEHGADCKHSDIDKFFNIQRDMGGLRQSCKAFHQTFTARRTKEAEKLLKSAEDKGPALSYDVHLLSHWNELQLTGREGKHLEPF